MNKHELYMREALNLALKSYANDEVPVGAIIVKGNVIIGRGNNQTESKKNSLYHAELLAINDACNKLGSWRLIDSTIYITLEPCLMCAGAILNSRISEIVFGAKNHNFGALEYIKNKIKITQSTYGTECSKLLSNFFQNKK